MSSPKTTIASGHEQTSKAAATTLSAGGNAFDAAVAASFASSITEPSLTSLGGGGFLLAKTTDDRKILFDFFVNTPGLDLPQQVEDPCFFPITVHFPSQTQDFNIGHASVACPGNLKGLLHVQRKLGLLPLEKVLQPAIELAEQGVELNSFQAYMLELLAPILTYSDAGKKLFMPKGHLLKAGEIFQNQELANFLKKLPDLKHDGIYGGDLAHQIERDMQANRGMLTAKDLVHYQVVEREPIQYDYRGHQVLTNPPPCFGGSLILLALKLLGTQNMSSLKWGSKEHLCLIATIMQEVDALRDQGILSPGQLDDGTCHKQMQTLAERRRFSRGTTHLCVADAQGNVASLTTSNGEASGYVIPGTGIMLNNMMGEDDLHPDGFHADPPGERICSMMAPTLVLKDHQLKLALGSGGSKRIRTAILQVISHLIDFELPLKQALEAPRLHYDGEWLQVEPGFDQAAVDPLKEHWQLNEWQEKNVYFGGAHAITPTEAAGDSRRGGHGLVIK